ncbi:sirohydrochlorin cobaltochelatase [Pectinatus cerevisiiphilus]|uniref:Sirohydrochlorin cobaltochelatase n=1 Tax=Pectinatus cerevisiiphilus TaxID=86956 RepID=A0A4R3KFJ2_9FIRM|nr:sirohydrochlorin cobaltochelatase [Pectinatus cerevisiiphilus]TCS82048.1 sirohydrochlorin cobaltochelatase [Pectinatus cerevisiiphilus]
MKLNWKKMLVASMACATLTGFMATSYASYKLNPEVTDATPALKQASEIGVRTYNNPQMANAQNKDAILVMSFGTTFKDSREKTIEKTVQQIQAAHPDTKVVLSFTSHIIIDRIKAKEGVTIPTPEDALKDLKAQGYTRVAIASLDVIPGMEYAYDSAVYDLYKKDFKKMTLGTSAMYWMGQENQRDDINEFLKAFSTQFPKVADDEAVLVMAHGTPDPSNAYYAVIQDRIDSLKLKNTYLYTVEGWPNLETIIPELKAKGIKKVTLMPMMMVAGDHANNDMAGDDPESHKSILQKEGFTVDTYIHGLGENEAVRGIFVERANEAWDALEAK